MATGAVARAGTGPCSIPGGDGARAHPGVGTSSVDGSNSGTACSSGGVARVDAGLGPSSGPGLPANSEIGVEAHTFSTTGFLARTRSDRTAVSLKLLLSWWCSSSR